MTIWPEASARHIQNSRGVSRRSVVRRAAAPTLLAIVPRHVLGGEGQIPPSQKTTVAGIGMGSHGSQNIAALLEFPEIQVIAVCDVNREGAGYLSWNWAEGKERRPAGREPARRAVDEHYARQNPSGQYRGCRAYLDFRELLEKEDIDAVMIATPDHLHAAITMGALKRKKHVYCEKPLTYSVYIESMPLSAASTNERTAEDETPCVSGLLRGRPAATQMELPQVISAMMERVFMPVTPPPTAPAVKPAKSGASADRDRRRR